MRMLVFIIAFVAMASMNSFAQEQSCDYSVNVIIPGNEFEAANFTWKIKATKIEGTHSKITGNAKIQDYEGKIIKSYKPWTSEQIFGQKTSGEYTPNLKPGSYELIAEIEVDCNDANKANNKDSQKITIKDSTNKIENQGKSSAKNPINEQNKITAQPINEDDESKTIYLNVKSKNNSGQKQSNTINNKATIYESSTEKAKNLILVVLLVLSVLLNIVLIWKR